MNRIAALSTLPLLAVLLASCGVSGAGQIGNPKVSDMDAVDARDMASAFCQDVSTLGQKEAVIKLATKLAGTDITKHDQDAILEFSYIKLCPSNF